MHDSDLGKNGSQLLLAKYGDMTEVGSSSLAQMSKVLTKE
jgi:hypothetical protein